MSTLVLALAVARLKLTLWRLLAETGLSRRIRPAIGWLTPQCRLEAYFAPGFGTFQGDDARRLKQLEVENAWLKKLVAERDLEIEVMKEITATKW